MCSNSGHSKKKKGKTKNVTRMEALKKNESWLKFALVNL
jgi:hypothetical protein